MPWPYPYHYPLPFSGLHTGGSAVRVVVAGFQMGSDPVFINEWHTESNLGEPYLSLLMTLF